MLWVLGSLNKSVLVVEDDPSLRDLYRAVLRSAGYDVAVATDGADALRYVEQQRPNAVVLDLSLPLIGGRDVHRELKSRPETRQIPIVVVTGTDSSDLDPRDFAAVHAKPIQPETLISSVRSSIRRADRAGAV